MYVLEFKENKRKGMNPKKNFRSFEDFEILLREKEKLESKENKCVVYKISNNGKEITRLTDKKEYQVVTDFDKECRKCWKQYVYIRDMLVKCGIRDFYVENNILYIKNGSDIIEIEMTRKTPRYEIRYNNKVVSDNENSQVDIVNKMFVKDKSRLRKYFLKSKEDIDFDSFDF